MQMTFVCPACQRPARLEVADAAPVVCCPVCQWSPPESPSTAASPGALEECLICGCRDLFVRANFPQRLGLTIVLTGFAASSIAWYYHRWFLTLGILFATALIDLLLYFTLGSLLECYRCRAQYRGREGLHRRDSFRLETHERYRQQALRLAESGQRAGGLAE